MSNAWQMHQERSTPLALKTIRWIALHLGRPPARLLLYPITLYFLLFGPAQRRASLRYLQRVLPHRPTWWDAAKHIHCFAATILDRVYLITGRFDKFAITFPPESLPRKYAQRGTGCILLGSHLGSFEVLRSYGVRKYPLPIKILMDEGQNPMIVGILNALNPRLPETVIPLGSPDSLLRVKDAVDAGSTVGLLGDRVVGMPGEKTVTCTLLGGQVRLPAAPVLIAASLKVPLIVFFGIYHGNNRYSIHFELLAERIELSRTDRLQDIRFWMQKYADLLEKYCRLAPYNWFNFYDYWQEESS
ncbi:MAG: LpxL/LpxP family acyltransferase [Gammaproteobacteria bacterium]